MNKCMDCGTKLKTQKSKRCYQCNGKIHSGKNNPQYKDGSWCETHFCIDCRKIISYQTFKTGSRRCIVCSGKYFSGKNRWNYKNGKPKCKDCGKTLASYSSIYCNNCKGKYIKKWRKGNYKGKNNPMYGKSTNTFKIFYNSIWFKSSWEANFAKWLNLSNVKWKYEYKTFYYEKYKYTPDFYLPEFDVWIEVKGYWRPYAKKKFLIFLKKFPHIKIFVFNQEKLQELSIIK